MDSPITFITANPGKAEQVTRYLHTTLRHRKLDLHEIQSLELTDIVRRKAQDAYQKIQGPVLVEDTSLAFHALGRLPGPLIKWFLQELHNEGLCRLIDTYEDRTATARVAFCLFDGTRSHIFDGEVRGTISTSPQGNSGFGWDPIFIPEGYDKTWGEMSSEEREETSMRKIALEKLGEHLDIQH